MSFNRRISSKDSYDFFPTPSWATQVLLHYEKFKGNIFEPACGTGNISEVLKKNKYKVFSNDIVDRGYGDWHQDFLQTDMMFDNIITNPPYNKANEFVLHALDHSQNKVAMLLRLSFLEGATRYSDIYIKTPPTYVYIFSKRVTFMPETIKGNSGSGPTAYAWFVWNKHIKSKSTKIKWIEPNVIDECKKKNI
ncbi:MAG: hypothetical protein IKC10_06350 [Alphaproteobacteria bacterium]|nr:hypothetical protein [Alphaproteobacteria bacterium]